MGRLVAPIECTVATRFTYRRVSAATHDLVEGRLGPITRGIREPVATLALLESSSTCAIGSDEVADARAPSTLRHVRRPTMAFPSLLLAPQASRLRARPDDRNCAQLRLPRSFLRRRLLRFVPTRRMELRTASPPSLLFAPQATRLRLRASGVGVRLLGLRVSQCGSLWEERARPSELWGGFSAPSRNTDRREPRARQHVQVPFFRKCRGKKEYCHQPWARLPPYICS